MGRLKRESLTGLAEFGARLRALREQAGLSQMKVAELMGFNPTHGYKYIIKLEKGTVPNPTLRTVVGFLEVCGADWADIAAALPHAGYKSGARPRPAPGKVPEPEPAPPPKSRPRDPRPLRVRLRAERIAERERLTQALYGAVARAEVAVTRLLRERRLLSSEHRRYLALVRPCCTLLQSLAQARPRAVENEIGRFVAPALAAGLDRALVEAIIRLCRESVAASGT
ncbi:MAG: helix-turn-helix transcriptional regulator [bacterium]